MGGAGAGVGLSFETRGFRRLVLLLVIPLTDMIAMTPGVIPDDSTFVYQLPGF